MGADASCQAFPSLPDTLVHENPGLKFVEIGAGTGATTIQFMKALAADHQGRPATARFAQYDYTDVSPFFFETAEDQFRYLGPKIQFKKLDIDKDPEGQGFEAGSYDVIVAAAVSSAIFVANC